jgi:hypothetical protein
MLKDAGVEEKKGVKVTFAVFEKYANPDVTTPKDKNPSSVEANKMNVGSDSLQSHLGEVKQLGGKAKSSPEFDTKVDTLVGAQAKAKIRSEESKNGKGLAELGAKAAVPDLSDKHATRLHKLSAPGESTGEAKRTIEAPEDMQKQSPEATKGAEGAEGAKGSEAAKHGTERVMVVTVPNGSHPGQRISVVQEDGHVLHVKVPKHMKPGMTFTVNQVSHASSHMDL